MTALVDTNILVYRFDPRFPDKQRRAAAALRRGLRDDVVRVPHQAIVEFVAAVTRPRTPHGPLLSLADAVREAEEIMIQFPVLYPNAEVVRLALRGAATYGLYWFDALKRDVRSTLSGARVSDLTTSKVIALIESDERRKIATVKSLRDAIAVYQGQATLGKIINVVIHEGRRPLSYFRNHFPLLRKDADKFAKTPDSVLVQKIVDAAAGIAENAGHFVELFGRLDPLAAQRRSRKKAETLAPVIQRAKETFSGQMHMAGVTCRINGDIAFKLVCWRQDIQVIFTNLIDNSLYWLGTAEFSEKQIEITISTEDGTLQHVDYKDSGPGMESEHIASGVIFDPEFSTKPEGTGLGLAIAGEAATRNGLELTALASEGGAWFRLQPALAAGELK